MADRFLRNLVRIATACRDPGPFLYGVHERRIERMPLQPSARRQRAAQEAVDRPPTDHTLAVNSGICRAMADNRDGLSPGISCGIAGRQQWSISPSKLTSVAILLP
jgi:hypothetical protein